MFWWFMNDFEPAPPDWYRPGKPLRTPFWYLRNPLQNAGRYVLGVDETPLGGPSGMLVQDQPRC